MFDPKNNLINFDLDGVLADFDKFVFDNMGRVFKHSSGPGNDQEMWNFLVNVKNLYYILEPTPYAYDLWNAAKNTGAQIEILTALPRRNSMPEAQQDKLLWVHKYFGSDVVVKFGPYSRDKQKHANIDDVLIDDRLDNIDDWNNAHGIGIYHDYNNHLSTLEAISKLINKNKIVI